MNLQELKCLPFSYLSESGIWLGRMTFVLPNSPQSIPPPEFCAINIYQQGYQTLVPIGLETPRMYFKCSVVWSYGVVRGGVE